MGRINTTCSSVERCKSHCAEFVLLCNAVTHKKRLYSSSHAKLTDKSDVIAFEHEKMVGIWGWNINITTPCFLIFLLFTRTKCQQLWLRRTWIHYGEPNPSLFRLPIPVYSMTSRQASISCPSTATRIASQATGCCHCSSLCWPWILGSDFWSGSSKESW
jgi:hypothetical protein